MGFDAANYDRNRAELAATRARAIGSMTTYRTVGGETRAILHSAGSAAPNVAAMQAMGFDLADAQFLGTLDAATLSAILPTPDDVLLARDNQTPLSAIVRQKAETGHLNVTFPPTFGKGANVPAEVASR
jgi:hypothetical protein